jgi:Metallo-beta-lactamase superfamily
VNGSKSLSLVLWLLTASQALGSVPPGSGDAGVAVEKVHIADGIYQFITAPDGYVPNGNCVVIVNENDVVVFDTFARPSTARTVLGEIRKITDKPVRYVVNSHLTPITGPATRSMPRHFPIWKSSRLRNRGNSC